jgi:hypothetical protein
MALTHLENLPSQPRTRVHVSEYILLRSGGISTRRLDELSSGKVASHVDVYNNLQLESESARVDLVDILYAEAATATPAPDLQRTIVTLKRDVFNGRAITALKHGEAMGVIREQARSAVRNWMRLQEKLAEARQLGEQILNAELRRSRHRIKETARIPEFRKGLLLSSPLFEQSLERYVASDTDVLDRKLRRTERTLLSYVARAAYKTSPLSTLTQVTFGRFTGDVQDPGLPALLDAKPYSVVRPNIEILSRIAKAITVSAYRHPSVLVGLKEHTEESGEIKYLRRKTQPILRKGNLQSWTSESMFWLPLSVPLRVVMEEFESSARLTIGHLRDQLAARGGLPDTEAVQFLAKLLSVDFLMVPELRSCLFDVDNWTAFSRHVGELKIPQNGFIAECLLQIEQLTRTYPQAEFTECREMLTEVRVQTQKAFDVLECTDQIPVPLIYEDSALSSGPFKMNRQYWEGCLQSLSELQRIFPLFDGLLVSRLSMRELFKKRYGTGGICQDVQSFLASFAEVYQQPLQRARIELADHRSQPELSNPLNVPEIDALTEARKLLRFVPREDGSSQELVIPTEVIEQLGSFSGVRSNSFFVQIMDGAEGPELVLNQVYSGLGSMFSRFASMFQSSGRECMAECMRTTLMELQPEGVLFAEMQGGSDTNANLHPLLSNTELVFPGERASGCSLHQVRISELVLRHDARRDCLVLFCDRLQKEVVPVYLGLLLPFLLPELHQLMLHFSYLGLMEPKSWLRPRPGEVASTVFQPRLRYKNIVLDRARWVLPRASVPQMEKDETAFDYLAKVSRWRKATGLPSRVFLAFRAAPSGQAHRPSLAPAVPREKPVYIDFENMLCVSLFENIVAGSAGSLSFTEALPAEEALWLKRNREPHVAEFLLELTQEYSQCRQ